LGILGLMTALASPLDAATFSRSPIAPELGLDALTRGVARERLGRDLFSNPWATVTIAYVDVYDRFPYVESRRFQIVSDPRWDRLVFGEAGRSLRAWDGRGGAFALDDPHGLAVDDANRVYVADTGHDRIVVLQATTAFDEVTLTPLHVIGNLAGPFDVAWSDGGTPFAPGDDVLYVADTGRNRVVALALESDGARVVAELGELGSGPNRFAGPMAISAGRSGGANTRDVYVADAHNRRIVHLRHQADGLRWTGETRVDDQLLTSLDADEWGNLYAAAPQQGLIRKFSPALEAVAALQANVNRPRDFHVPFVRVTDHRDGRVVRAGQPNGLSLEQWSDASGLQLWSLGVEVRDLAVEGGAQPVARFTTTDRATVTLEVMDQGRTLSRRALGPLDAGAHEAALVADDFRGASGSHLTVRVSAASGYSGGATEVASAGFQWNGTTAVVPRQAMLLGNTPNPVVTTTRIAFVLPDGGERVALAVFDATGRRVRTFRAAFSPGLNEVQWDGADDQGRGLPGGVYFCRLDVGEVRFARRLVLVR